MSYWPPPTCQPKTREVVLSRHDGETVSMAMPQKSLGLPTLTAPSFNLELSEHEATVMNLINNLNSYLRSIFHASQPPTSLSLT